MAIESTLLIVKPDGVRRGLVGEVIRRVEAKGLRLDELRLFTIAARHGRASTTPSTRTSRSSASWSTSSRAARSWWARSRVTMPSSAGEP